LTRAQHNDVYLKEDNFPAGDVLSSTEEIFNLATIRGAGSLGLENKVGSIQEGKKADIVIFDAEGSVGMLSATEFDPVVSVVRFSEAADIEFVIVDGKVRKRNGKLVDIETSEASSGGAGVLQWKEVAQRVRRSQKEIQERSNGLSMEKGREGLIKAFYVDESKLVDGTV
jgi:cytosine/adenosine deaminase-related metal-dependent hydrolase